MNMRCGSCAGDTHTPLWTGILANVVNVALNWVLIYGNLGMPALGVAGAGMASSLAMVCRWTSSGPS